MTDNEILDSIYENAVEGMTLLIDTYADLVYKVYACAEARYSGCRECAGFVSLGQEQGHLFRKAVNSATALG